MKTVEISLFSGVGMFSYGFQRVNPDHRVGCFVECEAFPQRVLRHHWPDVPIYDDVRDVNYERLKEDGIFANTRCRTGVEQTIISGGFPCQDLSTAGKQAGIDAERSGLWSEYARIIGELRHLNPIVFIENVPTLLTGGDTPGDWGRRVLRDIAEIFLHGDQPYQVEGHIVPAGSTVGSNGFRKLSAGAPHKRERAWIVAYPDNPGRWKSDKKMERGSSEQSDSGSIQPGKGGIIANTNKPGLEGRIQDGKSDQKGWERQIDGPTAKCGNKRNGSGNGDRSSFKSMGLLANGAAVGLSRYRWLPEPGIGRVTTGIPDRAAKLKALGNGLVWPIPASFMAALMDYYR